ncbi:hypothetical protein RGR602_CH03316 [Rhizobium gallicum bv. gallicum R602sp]|uniref:Uncharacterized protein n=1 Tax=Rhizobium gallicum bv. gallicum R602sp TaxID=1041138 RepID=A0A0B4X7B5_9HYPH|nr:hypothetical protein RGR602_CH03316 [Rhizobium gallicum bv. gallicum R602sp]
MACDRTLCDCGLTDIPGRSSSTMELTGSFAVHLDQPSYGPPSRNPAFLAFVRVICVFLLAAWAAPKRGFR